MSVKCFQPPYKYHYISMVVVLNKNVIRKFWPKPFVLFVCRVGLRVSAPQGYFCYFAYQGEIRSTWELLYFATTAYLSLSVNLDLFVLLQYCMDSDTSDKTLFPTFARTRPPDTQISKSVAAVLKAFNWTQVLISTVTCCSK